jgi:hypothetical protein
MSFEVFELGVFALAIQLIKGREKYFVGTAEITEGDWGFCMMWGRGKCYKLKV